MSTDAMTLAQSNYILKLANQLTGRRAGYLSQVRDVIGVGSMKLQRGLNKAEASAIIDDLKNQLAAKETC